MAATCRFSDSHEGGHVLFSPDGRLVAAAAMYRLVVRDARTLEIVHVFACVDRIDMLEWSCDSKYVLCGLFARGLAQVWSVDPDEADWHAKIDEGPLGLAHVRWAPDGRHVLATSDFRLRVTVWSLVDRSVSYLQYPKFAKEGLSFSADGRQMALAHRRDGRDSVQLVQTEGWAVSLRFEVASRDLADLRYAPRGDTTLCVLDGLLEPQALVYREGLLLATCRLQPGPEGSSHLGPKALSWSPAADLLAVCGHDERVRLLHRGSWAHVGDLQHGAELLEAFAPDAVAYASSSACDTEADAEAAELAESLAELHASGGRQYVYAAQRLPLSLPTVRPTPEKPNPRMGVGLATWSAGGRFLATRDDGAPRALWVWDGASLGLHSLLLQAHAVRAAAWHPTRQLLALCTGIGAVVLWSPRGCQTVPLPEGRSFRVCGLAWGGGGDALLLLDKDRFTLAHVQTGTEPEPPPPAPQLDPDLEEELKRLLAAEKGDENADAQYEYLPPPDGAGAE
ncbi:hypothetical protein EMIHUDRAFT_69733 [Emiliania huxleyi CCMP1516]|uniref:Anaphase-promoting complex subunit 4 WD40 domain-containing protein n=2 Tax=Emiliania huxleyi TaxID=2903 RepID=A0A0D3KX97_EMIH1|nr:hypothetical protein EMIHUDRAFT_69733 [Emiliania huxleyi CCMP1516]EOD40382.1 hypothetical protein EMIHUDRAFT_69733 [Emiliania huxleyi CCMP1516]|eukprot:XP_005792811.1 hypothetical protein EMIHUDRAFT_69733 [Emiliania huxleyi CCMP1516]